MLLDQFVDGYFHGEGGTLIAAFHPFDNTADFETRLEEHLRKLIGGRLQKLGVDAAGTMYPWSAEEAARPTWTKGSPFRGLAVFDFQHHDIFFGRTRAIGDVIQRLKRQAAEGRAFLLVLGVSGCGKSSLVRAGVLPMLVQPAVVEGVGLWRRRRPAAGRAQGRPVRRPGGCPAGQRSPAGTGRRRDHGGQAGDAAAGQSGRLRRCCCAAISPRRPERSPRPRTRRWSPPPGWCWSSTSLKSCSPPPMSRPKSGFSFFEAVQALAESGQTWVIATLRSDFYDRCAAVPALAQLKSGGGQYDLAPPDVSEIGQLVRRPAAVAGLRFEEDLETRPAAGRPAARRHGRQPRQPAAAGVHPGRVVPASFGQRFDAPRLSRAGRSRGRVCATGPGRFRRLAAAVRGIRCRGCSGSWWRWERTRPTVPHGSRPRWMPLARRTGRRPAGDWLTSSWRSGS